MQETNITFKGLSLTPYSDISPDGQLSACIGLESHGGALRPSVLQGKKYTLPDDGKNYTLVHVHTTSAYSHFIFASGDSLYWANVAEGALSLASVGSFSGFYSVNTVGNTLVILTSSGMHYALWKDAAYKYIGQQPPEIGISFGLVTTISDRLSDQGSVAIVPSLSYTLGSTAQITIADKDNQREYITNVVWETINKVIEGCTENNRFCMPFFVRAAYRRFDGSYTMLTSPILMIPDSTGPKALFVFDKVEANKLTGKVYGRAWSSLLVSSISSAFAAGLSSWSDIISSVDIFISPQVMRADSSEIIHTLYGQAAGGNDLSWHQPPATYGIGCFDSYGQTFRRLNFDWQLSATTMKYFNVAMKDEESFLQDLNGSMQFYKVRSISVGQLSSLAGSGFQPVLERSVDLTNIVQQESLPDSSDYQSHDHLSAKRSHVYNQRLHLFGIDRTMFAGFLPENAWAYTNDAYGSGVKVYVYIAAEDGATRIVQASGNSSGISQLGRFLYYPNVKANRMVIIGNGLYYDIPLQPHPLLNGAYYLFMDSEPSMSSSSAPSVSNPPVSMENKVYTSEVGDPFFFPLEGIYTVGSGQIYGLSSVATALSQGQFGQFPLMIFCSDGNYAMSVNEEGRYSAIHPMQRDVCVNPDAIVQTDSEVLFMSSRGVMVTSGAGASCISSELDGVPESLPSQFEAWIYPAGSPAEFFRTCRVAYDYANRRIIFFPSFGAACYVYSIQDAQWSSEAWGSIVTAINQFPYAYVQASKTTIYLLSETYAYQGEAQSGLIYTRPVKMDSFQLKRIKRLSVQGVFSAPQKVSIYVSNDCTTWHHLGTSTDGNIFMEGRPAKYWRFAIETQLTPAQNISALRIQYEQRQERRYR